MNHAVKETIALALSRIPTVDYYVTSRWEQDQTRQGRVIEAQGGLSSLREVSSESECVVVRHLPLRWVRKLKLLHRQNRKCVFVMDDDQPAAWRCRDVPILYGLRTSWRYRLIKHFLDSFADDVWVSTPVLQARYPGTRMVPPRWFGPFPSIAPTDCRRWGYHGTQIHRRELKWIVPVVEEVQARVPDAVFEVFGGPRLARQLSHISRVEVQSVRSWPDYLGYARSNPLAVGVAPLLPGHFNAARSHTKAFDIMRTGAVGVFSARDPYLSALQGSGALFAEDEPSVWAEHVVRLLGDPEERRARFSQHLEWLEGEVAAPDELQSLFDRC